MQRSTDLGGCRQQIKDRTIAIRTRSPTPLRLYRRRGAASTADLVAAFTVAVAKVLRLRGVRVSGNCLRLRGPPAPRNRVHPGHSYPRERRRRVASDRRMIRTALAAGAAVTAAAATTPCRRGRPAARLRATARTRAVVAVLGRSHPRWGSTRGPGALSSRVRVLLFLLVVMRRMPLRPRRCHTLCLGAFGSAFAACTSAICSRALITTFGSGRRRRAA